MNSTVDTLSQKISLIYEYNNHSPLFVRVAGIEIEKNNLDTAVEILLKGIELFPHNPIAHLLLGKVYTIKGNYDEALFCFKKGSSLINSIKTFDYYVKEIESIKKQRTFFNVDRWKNQSNENSRTPESADVTQSPISNEEIEETLTKLTVEIAGAEKTLNEAKNLIGKSQDYESNDLMISETLANIYINQKEYQAAISVYKRLGKKNPEKKEYFDSKIEELKSQFED